MLVANIVHKIILPCFFALVVTALSSHAETFHFEGDVKLETTSWQGLEKCFCL